MPGRTGTGDGAGVVPGPVPGGPGRAGVGRAPDADHNGAVAMTRSDRKLILVTTAVLVAAGLFFAGVLVFATRTTSPAADGPVALYIGPQDAIEEKLDEGSPLYFANPFGGRGFWVDRENGVLVAYDVGRYDDPDCSVRWRGRVNSYMDCEGGLLTQAELGRRPLTVLATGPRAGSVLVDVDTLEPPTGATG